MYAAYIVQCSHEQVCVAQVCVAQGGAFGIVNRRCHRRAFLMRLSFLRRKERRAKEKSAGGDSPSGPPPQGGSIPLAPPLTAGRMGLRRLIMCIALVLRSATRLVSRRACRREPRQSKYMLTVLLHKPRLPNTMRLLKPPYTVICKRMRRRAAGIGQVLTVVLTEWRYNNGVVF